MKHRTGWALGTVGLLGALALGSCTEGWLVTPARTVPVRLALGVVPAAAVTGTDADACAKANVARVQLLQGDAVVLDTSVAVIDPCASTISLSVPLRVQPGSLQLSVVLLANDRAEFEGSATVQLARGQATNAQVIVAPIPAGIAAPDSVRTFTKLGDSARVGAAVVFATGDTVAGDQPTWTVDNQVVSVANGFVHSVREGTAQLTASFQGLTHVTHVRVQAVVAQVRVSGVGSMFPGSSRAFTAVSSDSNGFALQRTYTWSSSNPQVATVNADGTVHALALGRTVIRAVAEAHADSVALSVVPVPVARVVVTPNPASVPAGETVQLTAATYDSAGNLLIGRAVSWSSNFRGAPVDASGLVTGIAGGTATITATSEGISGSATVTVIQPILAVTPGAVSVSSACESRALSQTLDVTNAGTGTVAGLSVAVNLPPTAPVWVTAKLGGGTAPTTLTLDFPLQICGSFSTTVTVSSRTPGTTPVVVPVTWTTQ